MNAFGLKMTQAVAQQPTEEKKSEEPAKVESKLPMNAREKLGKDAPQVKKPQAPVRQVTPADLEKPQMKGGYSQSSKV